MGGETTVGLLVGNEARRYMVDGTDSGYALEVGSQRCRLIESGRLRTLERLDCIDVAVELQAVEVSDDTATSLLEGSDAALLYARGTTLAAAFQVGIAQAALAQTLAFVKERQQFGQAIGGFQAIKHRCADMAVQAEVAWSITALAAVNIAEEPERRDLLVASAKAVADRAARFNTATNIQNHGGIGYTWEHGAHLFVSALEVFGELLMSTPHALRNVLEAPAA